MKIFILEKLANRLKAEGRPAAAYKLERLIHAIQMEGRVASSTQQQLDKILDIEAERAALREGEQRTKPRKVE